MPKANSNAIKADLPLDGLLLECNKDRYKLSYAALRWAKEIKQEKLPPGKYLARIYVDQTGKLAKDDKASLDGADLVREIEVTGNWPVGYGQMTVAKFSGQ